MKNEPTQAFSTIESLRANFNILLTATPIVSGITNLKSIFQLTLNMSINSHWNTLEVKDQGHNLFVDTKDHNSLLHNPPNILLAPQAINK